MEYSPILAPVVALVAWTLVMLVWMAIATRAFAQSESGRIDLRSRVGGSRASTSTAGRRTRLNGPPTITIT